jgi:hypothetical protein
MTPPVKPAYREMAAINGFDGEITRLHLAANAPDH